MGPVSRTYDLTRFHFCTLQRLAVMCATVFHCVKLRATAYDEYRKAVDIRGKGF
jgi:hypothetical protein